MRRATKIFVYYWPTFCISIHALREESDQIKCNTVKPANNFNPRSPWGERPVTLTTVGVAGTNFNPRSPWGERLYIKIREWLLIMGFQSTLSVRRATYKYYGDCQLYWISIHALREESDRLQYVWIWHTTDFNPRSPWGERPSVVREYVAPCWFQSTLSVRRATLLTKNQ